MPFGRYFFHSSNMIQYFWEVKFVNNNVRGITELKNYGKVEIKLRSIMDKKNVSIYQVSQLASLKHTTVKNYYYNCPISRVDLDVVSKWCYVLDCKVEDLLEYVYPN